MTENPHSAAYSAGSGLTVQFLLNMLNGGEIINTFGKTQMWSKVALLLVVIFGIDVF